LYGSVTQAKMAKILKRYQDQTEVAEVVAEEKGAEDG
jgi:hypothetical protein